MKYFRLGLALLLLQCGLAPADNLTSTIDSQKVLLQVNKWANAWSQRDIRRYIAAYSKEFKGSKQSHKEWLAQRQARIQAASSIKLKLTDIQLRSMSKNKAIVDFVQRYQSNRFSDRVKKRLTFKRIDGQWKIIEERTLSHL